MTIERETERKAMPDWKMPQLHSSLMCVIMKCDQIMVHNAAPYLGKGALAGRKAKRMEEDVDEALIRIIKRTNAYKKFESEATSEELMLSYLKQFNVNLSSFVIKFFMYFIALGNERSKEGIVHENCDYPSEIEQYLNLNKEGILTHVSDYNAAYERLEEFLFSAEFKQIIRIPLYNVSITSRKLELDASTTLEKVSPRRMKDSHHEHTFGGTALSPTVHIVYKRNIDKRLGSDVQSQLEHLLEEVEELTNELIDVMRLTKPGRIFRNHGYKLPEAPWGEGSTFVEGIIRYPGSDRVVHCGKKDEFDLVENWKSLHHADDLRLNSRHTSIRRYSMSLDRSNLGDAIVDVFVGLESLLLRDNTELSFRLSIRTAALLSKRKIERAVIYKAVKKAYGFRSQVVHGSLPPFHLLPPKKIDELTEQLNLSISTLRNVIIRMAKIKNKTLDKIVELLDEDPFSGVF